jgi:hypothetical protein
MSLTNHVKMYKNKYNSELYDIGKLQKRNYLYEPKRS